MYAYPNSIPLEEIRVLLPILRGNVPPAAEAAQAAWVVIGYGLSRMSPEERPTMAAAAGAPPLMGVAEVADHLEGVGGMRGGAGETTAVPWGDILRTLLPLVLKFLA